MAEGGYGKQCTAHRRPAAREEPPRKERQRHSLTEYVRKISIRERVAGDRQQLQHEHSKRGARGRAGGREADDEQRRGGKRARDSRAIPHERHWVRSRQEQRREQRVEGHAVGKAERLRVLREAVREEIAAR